MTLLEWRKYIVNALSEAGFENPPQEAKWLILGVLSRENSFLLLNPTYAPSPQEETILQEWLSRRLNKEPLSRIKGVREFWSLPFHLNEHTLDPRPDTEILVEGVLKWIGDRKDFPWRILDLGTGSGCILISLLYELKNATGIGIDLSKEALEMARFNAAKNGVETRATFCQGDWGEGLDEPFDIIVSNPPYIPLLDKKTLDKGVIKYDPSLALFGGEDGLECYRILAHDMKRLIAPEGLAVLEFGYGQATDVGTIFAAAGLETLFIHEDLSGIERVIGMKCKTA